MVLVYRDPGGREAIIPRITEVKRVLLHFETESETAYVAHLCHTR